MHKVGNKSRRKIERAVKWALIWCVYVCACVPYYIKRFPSLDYHQK